MSDPTSVPPEFGPEGGPRLPPWEERHRWGFINSLYLTVKEILLRPGEFFGRMPPRAGIWQPLLFAVLVGFAASFFQWMWALAGSSLGMFLEDDVGRVLGRPLFYGFIWFSSPFLVALEVVVTAVVLHLCLMLTGGGRAGLEASFRVVCYAQAPGLLVVLPFCGGPLALVWYLVVLVVGLQRIHATEVWRAVLAVFLPLLLCSASCGGLLMMLIGLEAIL